MAEQRSNIERAYSVTITHKDGSATLDIDATSREQAIRFARRAFRDSTGHKGPAQFAARLVLQLVPA